MERIDHTYIFPEKPDTTRSQKQKSLTLLRGFHIHGAQTRNRTTDTRIFKKRALSIKFFLPSLYRQY